MHFNLRNAAFAAMLAPAAGAPAQQAIPLRDAVVVATTPVRFGLVFGVREFANGAVLVNDGQRRRLSALDSTLQHVTIIADTGAGAPFSYGMRPSPFVPYRGDTVLFVDYSSQSLVMLDSHGRTGRVLAPPKAADLRWITGSAAGTDAAGRLVYRSVRPSNELSLREIHRLVEPIDEWAITADGSIAIVRGQDYHIDWINADGSRVSTPRLPFDWRRLTDGDKQRMVDSARAVNDANIAAGRAGYTPGEAASFGGTPKIVTAPNGTRYVPVDLEFVPLADLPDYYPPIRTGAVKADADGNLWILPTTTAQSRRGGLVYDVVNRRGELTGRVELPAGRSIAGFGRGGVLYLMSGDRTAGFVLERARMR